MSEEQYVLEVRNISKAFPGVQALQHVNFSLKQGNIHALVGENGAGKSTLIKILSGVHTPDEGEILLHGEQVTIHNPRQAHTLGIFTIHQELSLALHMSVAENIYLGMEKPVRFGRFIDWDQLYEQAGAILRKLGTAIDPRQAVGELKVGEQQLVEIAKGLVTNPKVLILDEPTSALSSKEIIYLFKVLNSLKQEGFSVIYISHRLEEIFEIADTVTVLRDGQEVITTSIDTLTTSSMTTYMTGKDISLIDRDTFRNTAKLGEILLDVRDLSGPGCEAVSFTLRRGEILGMAGLMGAGRTEISKILYGAVQRSRGQIHLEGKEVEISSPQQALAHGIAYTTEDRKNDGLLLEQSVMCNISISVLKEIARRGWIGAKELEISDAAKLKYNIVTSSLQTKIKHLSGGNQQKALIARALACKLNMIILDEPTKGIDVGAKQEIYHLVRELSEAGLAVLFISSEISEVVDVSDRILLIRDGGIVTELDRTDASKDIVLEMLLKEVTHAKMD
jgi:ABC-type sugar transport system ATPase subunit